MQASPVNVVCGPLDKATAPSMPEPSGVASTSAVKLPLCDAAKDELPNCVPLAETVMGAGGPEATEICAIVNRKSTTYMEQRT
jgi:hypothetical protein